jgi:prepilin-type N-terminal cleavage/methylation domain-containing protein
MKRKSGFTLVELIVVIAVVLLLSAGSLAAYRGITLGSRRSALTSDAAALAGALNSFNALSSTKIGVQTNVGTNQRTTLTAFQSASPANAAMLKFVPVPATFNTNTVGIILTVPSAGLLHAPRETLIVFDSHEQFVRALSFLSYSNTTGQFSVNTARINASNGLQFLSHNGTALLDSIP